MPPTKPHVFESEAFLGADDASTPSDAHPDADANAALPAIEDEAACTEAPIPVEAALSGAPARSVSDAQLAQWIEAVVEHDERALAALYDATLSRVYAIVLRVVRKPALAEEVVEDTYFQVWRQALRFDPARGKPLTWLLGMARSRAIDALRREARFQHESLNDDALQEVHDDTIASDELLDVARGHADLHRALMLLNAQPRQLVALAFFNGLSHEEIATQTHLPLGTVKSQIRRALITLREVLGKGGMPALAS